MSLERLEAAIALVKNGDPEAARPLLIEFLTDYPQDEIAWMYLFKTLKTDKERVEALEHCLRLNPQSQWAQKELAAARARLEQAKDEQPVTPPPPFEPMPLPEIPPGLFESEGESPALLEVDTDAASIFEPDTASDAEVARDSTPSGIRWTTAHKPLPEATSPGQRESRPETDSVVGPGWRRRRFKTRMPLLLVATGVVAILVVTAVILLTGIRLPGISGANAGLVTAGENTAGANTTPDQSASHAAALVATATPVPQPTSTATNVPTPRPTVAPLADLPAITRANAAQLALRSQWFADEVVDLAFSPDGRWLAAAAWDGTIWIWETTTFLNAPWGRGQEIYRVNHPFGVNSVAFSPDGDTLAYGLSMIDRPLRLLDLSRLAAGSNQLPADVLEGHTDGVKSVAFAPNNRVLASSSFDDTIRFWNLATGKPLGMIEGYTFDNLVFSPDGHLLAGAVFNAGYTTLVWDVSGIMDQENPTLLFTLDGGPGMAFIQEGEKLATGEQRVLIWDTTQASGNPSRPKSTLPGHTQLIEALALSPDGHLLASGGRDRKIKIWDLSRGDELAVLVGHGGRVRSLAFSPDGSLLASAADDGTVRIWAVSTP